jgi:Na+(H+)/acetate symporter ActP
LSGAAFRCVADDRFAAPRGSVLESADSWALCGSVDQATAKMGKPVDDPSFTFILRASYLVLAPVLAGLAASTALRAALYAGCALYLMPAASFSWDLIQLLLAGEGPPSESVVINWVRTMLGSAVAGGVLGLLTYGVKRLVGKAVALARR